jgi:hypothetical protein
MALPLETYLNGISAFCVLITGVYFGFRFIMHYNSLKKSLLPLIAGLGFGLAIFYLGPTTAFFSLLFTEENIPFILYGVLSYFTMPLTLLVAMYLGFDIFKPSWKKRVMIFFIIFTIIWWSSFLFFIDSFFEQSPLNPGDLMDVKFVLPIGLPMIGIAILSTLILLGGGFLSIARKIEDKKKRKKSMFLAFGWTLFAVAGVLDTFLSVNLIAFARLTMLVGYLLIFSGFTPVYKKED